MIKKIIIWLVITMFVGLIMGGALIAIGMHKMYPENYLEENVDETKTFDIQETKTLIVNAVSEDIRIIPEERNDIKVHLHGTMRKTENLRAPEIKYSYDQGISNITIKEYDKWVLDLSVRALKLDVYVPVKYQDELKLKSISGDINTNTVSADKLEAISTSGDININDFTANKLFAKTTSGDVNVFGNANDFESYSTSGDVKFEGNMITGNFRTVSGDIDIVSDNISDDWNIDTTSGDVNIDLGKDASYKIIFESTSGEMLTKESLTIIDSSDNSFEGKKGDANAIIAVDTVSGDFFLNNK